jgi:AI-2 transport protein TqsA
LNQSFSPVSRALIVSAAVMIIIAMMKASATLIVPFLLSGFIAVICFPLMCQLQNKGLPKGVSLTLVMLLVIMAGLGLTYLVGASLTDFSRMMPVYQQRISEEWAYVLTWLNDHGVSVTETLREMINPAAAVGLVSTILKGFGNVLTNSFLIILTVIFILLEAAGLAQKFDYLRDMKNDQSKSRGVAVAEVFAEKLRNYMGIKTVISMATGLIISFALWLIGVDYPVLWGMLAFMLNFIPNIGSIIAAVPAVLLTIVQLGFSSAILVACVYMAVNILVGSIIEPKFMGKGLGLSTLIVFVSLIFWGWVLGPVGMLLSVPLTITVKLALDSNPETLWLGHMLGPVDDYE